MEHEYLFSLAILPLLAVLVIWHEKCLFNHEYGVDKMKADAKNRMPGFIPPMAGFTLVEVVIATALLILSLAAFTASFVQSRRSAAISDNKLDAIHAARGQMESICSSNYTALSVGTHSFSSGIYTGVYTISCNTVARVKDITVMINWINPPGRATSTVSLAGSVSPELHQ